MQYMHAFHAGNFADLHKHIAVLQVISALQKKPKGFLYLDTHAGAGMYDLAGSEARRGGESDAGIERLMSAVQAATLHPAIRQYVDCISQLRTAHGRHCYPGSPLMAALALRATDAALCVESQAPVSRALQREFEKHAPQLAVQPRVVHGDGYHEVRAALPPPLRRGFILIDPPYETDAEEKQIAAALSAGVERFETGVFAVWYPIKRQHDADLFVARILRGIDRPALTTELCIHAADHGAGLNGSGMLVVNPPWQFDTDAAEWQPQLHTLLGGDPAGGSSVKWLRAAG